MAEKKAGLADRVLSHWQTIAMALAAVMIVNVLVHVLVIRRTGAVSGDREIILKSARERTETVRTEVDGLRRTAGQLACAHSDVEMVFDDLLSSKQERMTAIQREVRKLAKDRGLDPERISYSADPIKDTGLVRFTVSFPLEGEYATLQDFVKAVEESKNFLIVEQVHIDESNTNKLKLMVELATYFQAPDAAQLAQRFAAAGRS